MKVDVIQTWPDGRQMVRVGYDGDASPEQVEKTLAQDHGLETLTVGEAEQANVTDSGGQGQTTRTVEVRANSVIDGI